MRIEDCLLGLVISGLVIGGFGESDFYGVLGVGLVYYSVVGLRVGEGR